MIGLNRIHRIQSKEHGAALLIVLAFMVLLTVLSVAYLSRATTDRSIAQGSFNRAKANELVESATHVVIGDLRQEIMDANNSNATTVGSITIYTPKANTNMVVMRSGTPAPGDTPIPNLVRRSWSGDANLNPRSRASNVSSGQASANGRSISAARWNKHYLVPRPAGANPTSTEPVGSFALPDWVIACRSGPAAIATWNSNLGDGTPSNDNYAMGRYAYAIYDEGGLLDANVAGYPSNAGSSQSGLKGVSAFADLSQLGLTSGATDALVGWRNYASAQPSGNFPNFNFNSGAVTNYVNFILKRTAGFTSVATNTVGSGQNIRTDQGFVSRQMLVQFAASSGFTSITNALQYLGTFSRELNAPTWSPTQDALAMGGNNGSGNIYAYKANANSSTAINRNLLSVRVINSFLRADGTTAAAGDALINQRFPLTRLAGLGPTGIVTTGNSTIVNGVPTVASATTIQRDFGLLWDSSGSPPNNRWNYVGASTQSPRELQPRILTLGEVAQGIVLRADGSQESQPVYREPNFFELLKAAILSGSVGMGSGSSGGTFVNADAKFYSTSTPTSSDYQIMQVGANIISQWDSSNTPTFVYFGTNELAGIKNLPYLSKLVFKPYWKKQGSTYTFDAWLLPSLWNPHQNAPPAAQNIRLIMTLGTMTANATSPNSTSSLASTQFMVFGAGNFGTSPSAPTTVVSSQSSASITQSPDNYYGFHFPTSTITAPSNLSTAYPDFGTGCDFELQIQINGNWKSYQKWKGCAQPASRLVYQSSSSPLNNTALQDPEFVTLDPRTLRFGVWGNAGNQSTIAADYTEGTQGTLDWPTPRFERITALPPQGASFASPTSTNLYLYANNVDGTVRYIDLDGVQRLGDFISGATTAMLPTNWADRPLVLSGAFQNGVFQSVAELGHVFRDQPWKTLNFTTASPNATVRSADAGLLDVFTLHESSMEAGKSSLNTSQAPVLTAILSQAAKRLTGANVITSTERGNIVTALQNLTTAQPMINKAELVTRLAADSSVTGLGNKEARECVIRAFSDACQTRTWNLMIDIIAQSGRYPANATGLDQFMVDGEQRYWVHVAIDRFTGQVIDRQVEVVKE